MKKAIDEGRLSVPQAKRIAAVITPSTQTVWIDRALELTQRELDREIAKEMPEKAVPERIIPKSKGRLKLELGMSEDLEKEIRRVQDVLGQRMRRAVTLEDALGVLCKEYLRRNDPMEIAGRSEGRTEIRADKQQVSKPVGKGTQRETGAVKTENGAEKNAVKTANVNGTERVVAHIPRNIQHQIRLKTGGICTAPLPLGGKCGATRWLDFHHIISRSKGGTHTVENLTQLCSSHHRASHEEQSQVTNY